MVFHRCRPDRFDLLFSADKLEVDLFMLMEISCCCIITAAALALALAQARVCWLNKRKGLWDCILCFCFCCHPRGDALSFRLQSSWMEGIYGAGAKLAACSKFFSGAFLIAYPSFTRAGRLRVIKCGWFGFRFFFCRRRRRPRRRTFEIAQYGPIRHTEGDM